MVKQIHAWQAEDGSVHATEQQAATHDARCQIKSLGIFNEATLNAVLENAAVLHTALGIVVRAQPAKAS